MITCDKCNFWEQEKEKNLGVCDCDKFKQGYYYNFEDIADDEIWVENDEGWAFYTGPKFGCIHAEIR